MGSYGRVCPARAGGWRLAGVSPTERHSVATPPESIQPPPEDATQKRLLFLDPDASELAPSSHLPWSLASRFLVRQPGARQPHKEGSAATPSLRGPCPKTSGIQFYVLFAPRPSTQVGRKLPRTLLPGLQKDIMPTSMLKGLKPTMSNKIKVLSEVPHHCVAVRAIST